MRFRMAALVALLLGGALVWIGFSGNGQAVWQALSQQWHGALSTASSRATGSTAGASGSGGTGGH